MRRTRLQDFFAGKPVIGSRDESGSGYRARGRGAGRKDQSTTHLPFDTDGLIERGLNGDELDVEGFVLEALRALRRLWHSVEDGVEDMKRSGTSNRRRGK